MESVSNPIEQVASEVVNGITEQAKVSGGDPKPEEPSQGKPESSPEPPATGGPGAQPGGGELWRREPKANFETDESGQVKLDAAGKPRRRGGRPRKPRPGDELADGSIFQPTGSVQQPASPGQSDSSQAKPGKIVIPDEQQGGGDQPRPAEPEEDELGPLVAEGLFAWISEKLGGGEAQPTKNERAAAERYAGRAFGRWRIHPLFGLGLIAVIYGARAWRPRKSVANTSSKKTTTTKDNKGAAKHGDQASARSGGHADGEINDPAENRGFDPLDIDTGFSV